MFKEGFLNDVYQFFYKLLVNIAKGETPQIASFLALFTFGILIIFLIGFLASFIFVVPKEIHRIANNLEKIRYSMDDDRDE